MEAKSPPPTPTVNDVKPLATEKKKPGRKKKAVIPIKIVHHETPITITFD